MLQTIAQDLYAKGFSSMEVDLGGRIFTAVVKVKYDQPLEEGWIYGTSTVPTDRTKGRLKEGSGEIEFAKIDEATDFIEGLGNGFYDKIWNATFTYYRLGQKTIQDRLYECRVLNVQKDYSEGNDAIGATIPISFKIGTTNGLMPVATL